MNNLSSQKMVTKIEILKAKKAAGILTADEAALLEELEAQYTEELIQTLQAKQAAGLLTLDEAALLEQLVGQYPEAVAKKEDKPSDSTEKAKDAHEAEIDAGIVDGFSASPALGGLAALGGAGGGGSSAVAGGSSFSGSLINGYISNARVFQDTNGDGFYAVGEPVAFTNSLGEFTLTGNLTNGAALIAESSWTDSAGIAQTATDQTTGANVSTVFTAPAGSTVVSPFTTLMSAGMTEEQVRTAFGIADDIPVTSFDPIATAKSTTATAIQKQAALQYKAASTAVANILDLATETLVTEGDPTSAASITKIVANAISENVTSDGTYNIENADLIASTLEDSIIASGVDLGATNAGDLAASLSNNLKAINTAMLDAARNLDLNAPDSDAALNSIYRSAKVAQEDLSGVLKSIVSPADDADVSSLLSDLENNFDVAGKISSAVIPDPTLFGGIDFELVSSEYTLIGFEGASASLVADPDDVDNQVMQFTRGQDSKFYAGVSIGYLSGGKVTEILLDGDAGNTTVNVKIWSPTDGIVTRLEVQDYSETAQGNDYYNVHAEATLQSGWNDVVFDFSLPAERYVSATGDNRATGLDNRAFYDKLNLFIDWENGKAFDGTQVGTALSDDITYYVDDIILGFGDPQFYAGDGSDGSDAADSPSTAATFTLGSSDAAVYTDDPVNVTNLDPNWGQATDLQAITDTEAGKLLKFSGFNYQGIEITSQDVSAKEHLHLDVWSQTTGKIKVGIISLNPTAEHMIEFDVTGGQWNSIDLDLADFGTAGVDLTAVAQIKFDTGSVAVSEFFVDNLVFTAPANAYSESPASPADLTGYSLVFEDEFNTIGASPDATNWTFDTGNDGWGNNEVQDYQSDLNDAQIIDWDPSEEVNGALKITAQQVDGVITSARVKSNVDLDPYGYYEVRAKLPSEDGAWPAIWLLGDGGRATWPNEGEIDLVEWSSAYAGNTTSVWSGNAYNPVNGVNVSDNQVSANAWDVNLSGAVALQGGSNYTVTFDAKGEDGRTLIAGIGESGGAYRNDSETVTISSEWETYTLHLTAIGSDSANFEGATRVLFDMGLDAGAINLDNVKISSGHNGNVYIGGPEEVAGPEVVAGPDLMVDGSFDGTRDSQIISALHYPDAHGGSANDTTIELDSAVDEWHTYQLWWESDSISIGVDGTKDDAHLVYNKPDNATNDSWPFDGAMDMILNVAIGGTLGGAVPVNDFSYDMYVDYVRVYQEIPV